MFSSGSLQRRSSVTTVYPLLIDFLGQTNHSGGFFFFLFFGAAETSTSRHLRHLDGRCRPGLMGEAAASGDETSTCSRRRSPSRLCLSRSGLDGWRRRAEQSRIHLFKALQTAPNDLGRAEGRREKPAFFSGCCPAPSPEEAGGRGGSESKAAGGRRRDCPQRSPPKTTLSLPSPLSVPRKRFW